MLKKNLRLLNILWLFILFGCHKQGTDVAIISHERNLCIKNDTITYKILDSNSGDVTYRNCFFNYSVTENLLINSVVFSKCTFEDMDFMKCGLVNILFRSCYLREVRITNSKGIQNLKFERTIIDKIVIDQSTFESVYIASADQDTINTVLIQNCNNSKLLVFSGNFKEIILEGGQIENIDITKITNRDCRISVMSTAISSPNLLSNETKEADVFFNASWENAQFSPNSESIFTEELIVDSLNTPESNSTDKVAIKKRYITIRTAYNHLAKVFANQKKYDLSDYFEYRSKVCDRKITHGRIANFFSILFHDKIRGRYGTSSVTVLTTMAFTFFLFTSIYLILGCFKYSFGFYINTKLFGDNLENEKPTLITVKRNVSSWYEYIKHCFLFSLNQMILGGISRDFHIYDFSTWFLFPPRKYGPIGLGRYISLFQNVIGLMLLFFLITAFLRLNR